MKRKVMTRITAFLLAFLMVCGSVFIEPPNVQAAAKATKITLSAKKKTLYVGKSFTLKVKSVQPQNASKKVTYKSSNKNVASVNTKGKVTAKSIGNATITVTSKANKKAKAKCKITVAQGVTDIQTASTLVMQKKKSVKLHFGITPNNASKKEVKFSSNKKSVAAVTKKGVITAKKAGTAKITLKSADGCKQKTVTVKVKNKLKAAEKVTLSKNSLSLEKGKSEQLTATISPDNAGQKVVYWISSNTDVATVDKNGKVTASGMGSATITAYAADHSGKKAVCTVNVASEADSTVAVTSVTVVPAALALKTGETSAPLKAVITPENATNKAVAWSSSNEGVASVSANGAVTAKTAGTATITAKTADGGKTASCLVTVTASGKPEPVFNGNGSKYEYGHFTTEAVVLDANSEEGNPNGSYSIYHIMDYTKDVPYADSYDANGATDGNNTASMYVITSGDNALLIDMGNGAASTASHFGEDSKDEAVIARLNQEFKDLVEALAAGRRLEIAISHQHGDHVGYSSAMKEYKVYYPEGDVNDKMKDRFKDYNFTTFTPGDAFKIQVGDLTVDTLLCAGHTNASTIYIINTPVVTYNEDKTKASAKYMVFSSDAVGSGSSVWLFSAAGMRQFDEGIDEVVEKLEGYSSYNAGSGLGTKNDATIQLLGGHGWQYENRFGTMSMDISYVRNMKELIHRLADKENWRYDGQDGKTLEEWMAEGYVVLKDVGNMGRYTAYYGNPKTSAAGITGPHTAMLEYAGKPAPTFKENGSKYEYGHFTTEAVVLDANSEEGNPNGSYSIYHIMDYTKDVPYADSYDANGATDGNNTASMYVITSGNNALLIDMGNGAASTASHFGEDSKDEAVIARLNQEFKDLVEALAAGRHLEIAISHQHGDHVGYSSAMKEYKVYYPEGDVNDKMKDRFKDYNFTTFTPGDAFKIQVGDLTVDTLLCAGHTNASTIYIINTPIVTYNEDKTQASAKYMVFSSDAVGSGSSVWLFSAAGMRQFDEGIDEVVEKLESYSSYNAGSGLGTKNDATIQLLGGHGWQYENRFGTMTMDISYVRNMKELIHRLADRNNWRFDGDGGKTLEEWMAEGYVVLKDVGNMGRYTAYYGNPKTSAAGITGPYTAMVEYASSGFGEGEASIGSNTMQYRLYDPSAHGYEAESYPLVLFLHGEDGKGTDNVKQLTANEGAMLWVAMADENPAYVLAPQINTDDWTTDENTALVKKALDDVMKNPKVDTDRIYVQGMSMGGTGTWKMLLEYPDIFAGGMPICGKVPENYYAGISETDPAENPFTALANMPIWAFHTADDQTISADETARAVDALKAAGSKCVKYEEFSAGSTVPDAHAVWKRVYEIGTPYNWLMMQSRARTENNTKDPSMLFSKKVISDTITRVCDYELGQVFVVEDKNEVLIIDSAMGGFGAADLYAYIRDEVLVNKDAEFDVVLTHNHVDHILGLPSLANSGKLKKIYVHEKDREGLMSWLQRFNVDESYLADIKEGDTLSVGGKHLEVVETPAHTKGSICLFYDNYLFTGDAIGSGDLWLLGEYAVKDCIPGIQHLVDEIEKRGKNFELLTGHAENKYTYSNQYAKDILACVKGIVDGSIDFTIYTRRVGDYATYGSGNTFFQKSQINTLE
ncbi:MAG: MBL fold metallo-hydrolase [Eubacterium sp.]|nr:MBL fold metallo-hydrolase [Eubacterium sp.]